jgi:hypothetical protein
LRDQASSRSLSIISPSTTLQSQEIIHYTEASAPGPTAGSRAPLSIALCPPSCTIAQSLCYPKPRFVCIPLLGRATVEQHNYTRGAAPRIHTHHHELVTARPPHHRPFPTTHELLAQPSATCPSLRDVCLWCRRCRRTARRRCADTGLEEAP